MFKKEDAFKVHWVEIDKLKRAKYNPKKDIKAGDKDYLQIRESLKLHGIGDPEIINYDLTLIDGHQRITVIDDLLRQGFEVQGMRGRKVPCWVMYIQDKNQEAALNIGLDRIRGKFDWPKMRDILLEIDSGKFDVEVTGFGATDIERLVTRFGDEYVKPELEFAEDLLLEHNYVILYFDNPFDWEVAKEVFGLEKKKQGIDERKMSVGIGRVVRGKEWLDRLRPQ